MSRALLCVCVEFMIYKHHWQRRRKKTLGRSCRLRGAICCVRTVGNTFITPVELVSLLVIRFPSWPSPPTQHTHLLALFNRKYSSMLSVTFMLFIDDFLSIQKENGMTSVLTFCTTSHRSVDSSSRKWKLSVITTTLHHLSVIRVKWPSQSTQSVRTVQ